MTPTDRVRAALEEARDRTPYISAFDRYSSVLREMDGHVLIQGWQPIETAPKVDGKKILLAKFVGHPEHETCCWWVSSAKWSDKYGKFWDGVEPSGFAGPTHWMPLPDAPYVGRGKE